MVHASGKGLTETEALTSALGEAVECYASLYWDDGEVVYGRQANLAGPALDPRRLGLYRPHQYKHLPYAPYSDETVLGWVPARSLVSNETIFVPALAVFMAYRARQPQEFICATTSNGLATGPTLAQAILWAAYEVIERDAFIISWLNRLPGTRVNPASHPNPDIVDLCRAYGHRQVEFRLYHLPTDQPGHVFMALSLQLKENSRPAVVVGLGAGLEAGPPARRALLESVKGRVVLGQVMTRPKTRQRIAELAANPKLVTTSADHALRYASPAALPALEFWLDNPVTPFEWQAQPYESAAVKLNHLVNQLGANNQELIYYNLTPPRMRQLGLHTVRVILPEFQPLHFGLKERRLANKRLYQLPHRLKLTPAPTRPAQLNRHPHPFA